MQTSAPTSDRRSVIPGVRTDKIIFKDLIAILILKKAMMFMMISDAELFFKIHIAILRDYAIILCRPELEIRICNRLKLQKNL